MDAVQQQAQAQKHHYFSLFTLVYVLLFFYVHAGMPFNEITQKVD